MLGFNKEFIKNVETIKKASDSGKLILFVGAGVSKNSGIPDWNELTKSLKEDIDVGEESDPLKVAQIYKIEHGPNQFVQKVKSSLSLESARLNPIHKLIFELNPAHILTTNFDNLLEKAAELYHYPYSIVRSDRELPGTENSSLLVKIHGDLTDGQGNFVLAEDDYLEYDKNYPLIKSFIEYCFSTCTILFIGYGYQDNNLKIILSHVRGILDSSSGSAFVLRTDDPIPSERRYFEHNGIKTISLNSEVRKYLTGVNPYMDMSLQRHHDGLEEKGLELHLLMNFLLDFNLEHFRI